MPAAAARAKAPQSIVSILRELPTRMVNAIEARAHLNIGERRLNPKRDEKGELREHFAAHYAVTFRPVELCGELNNGPTRNYDIDPCYVTELV